MGRKRKKGQKVNIRRFGEKLLTVRTQFGLTQEGFAHRLGYSTHSYIAALEKGQKQPSLEIVLCIARSFNVSTDQLLKDELELEINDANESLGTDPARARRNLNSNQRERTGKEDCNE